MRLLPENNMMVTWKPFKTLFFGIILPNPRKPEATELSPSRSSTDLSRDELPKGNRPPKGVWLSNLAANGIWIMVLFAWVSTIAAHWHPWLELATHFSFHWLGLTGFASGLSLLHRLVTWTNRPSASPSASKMEWFVPSSIRGLTHLAAFATFLWIVAPWNWLGNPKITDGSQRLRVLSWNVWLNNHSGVAVERQIAAADADIVALFEVNPELAEQLESVRRGHIEALWTPEWDSDSTIILSRIPGTRFEKINLANVGMEAVQIDVPAWKGKRACRFLAVHTKSPTPFHPSRTRARDRQLADVAEWASRQTGPAAVMGDFNVTPFSPTFRNLLKNGSLIDSRNHFGNQASWPYRLGSLGIPIDHLLYNAKFKAMHREVVRSNSSSDHCPLIVDLIFVESSL